MTPCAACAVPIASIVGFHVAGSASITETVIGGGFIPAKNPAIILSRKKLNQTIPPTMTASSRIATGSRHRIGIVPQHLKQVPAEATPREPFIAGINIPPATAKSIP